MRLDDLLGPPRSFPVLLNIQIDLNAPSFKAGTLVAGLRTFNHDLARALGLETRRPARVPGLRWRELNFRVGDIFGETETGP